MAKRKKIMKPIGFTEEQDLEIRIYLAQANMTYQEFVSMCVDEKIKQINKLKKS